MKRSYFCSFNTEKPECFYESMFPLMYGNALARQRRCVKIARPFFL